MLLVYVGPYSAEIVRSLERYEGDRLERNEGDGDLVSITTLTF